MYHVFIDIKFDRVNELIFVDNRTTSSFFVLSDSYNIALSNLHQLLRVLIAWVYRYSIGSSDLRNWSIPEYLNSKSATRMIIIMVESGFQMNCIELYYYSNWRPGANNKTHIIQFIWFYPERMLKLLSYTALLRASLCTLSSNQN